MGYVKEFNFEEFVEIVFKTMRGRGKFSTNSNIRKNIRRLYTEFNVYTVSLINGFIIYYLDNEFHKKYDIDRSKYSTYVVNCINTYITKVIRNMEKEKEIFVSLNSMMEDGNDPSSDLMVKGADGVTRVKAEVLPQAEWAKIEYLSAEKMLIEKEIINFCERYIIDNYGNDYLELFKGGVTQVALAEKLGVSVDGVNRNFKKIRIELLKQLKED